MKLKEHKILIQLAKEQKYKMILCIIGIFIGSFANTSLGYLSGKSIEEITRLNLDSAIFFLFLYLFIEIFSNFILMLSSTKLTKVELAMAKKIELLTYQKTLDLPAYAFEEKTSGEFINRITYDTSTIVNSFDQIIDIIIRLITSFVVLIYIFYNSVIIGLEIIAFLLIFAFVVRYYKPKLERSNKERKKIGDNVTSVIAESLKGIREIKTLGIKSNLFINLQEIINNQLNKSYHEKNLYLRYDLISNILKSLLEVGVFITGAILLYHGHINLTFFIAMTYYIYRYTWLIENITSFTRGYNEVLVSLKRINEILENKIYMDVKFGKKELKNCKGIIKFENVKFNYPNDEAYVLENFNATFMPHQKIGIVGKSGQGKTTIFNLLTRLFDTDVGNITIDDINIEELSEKDIRKNISIIRQDPFLFNKTIKDNFKILNPKLTSKEIRKFCKLAYIDDYIMSLPQKYNTILGEGGVNLSGGQKQRLAIARAFAKQSKIILFDEATSALDNESQDYIKKVIDDLVKDHTVLIIAHRLSTIMDADLIYVIDKGKVTDIGTHEELIKKSKAYKTLYEKELN